MSQILSPPRERSYSYGRSRRFARDRLSSSVKKNFDFGNQTAILPERSDGSMTRSVSPKRRYSVDSNNLARSNTKDVMKSEMIYNTLPLSRSQLDRSRYRNSRQNSIEKQRSERRINAQNLFDNTITTSADNFDNFGDDADISVIDDSRDRRKYRRNYSSRQKSSILRGTDEFGDDSTFVSTNENLLKEEIMQLDDQINQMQRSLMAEISRKGI